MKRILIAVLAACLLVVGLSACGVSTTQRTQTHVVKADENESNGQLNELRQNEPLPRFHDSAALHVQDAYYTADADPNKVWYVTLVALDGTPYAHFTTRGAPQPAGDQVTNPSQLYCQHNGGSAPDGCGTIGLPEPNGVHQSGDSQGYVAILTTGALVRIPENAIISDQPFTVTAPVKLSINENAAISHTDETKATGGVVPTGSGTRASK